MTMNNELNTTKQKQRAFTFDYKLKNVAAPKKANNKTAVAVKMKIECQVLSRWCKSKKI